MENVKIEGLRDAAYRAYYSVSFSPEKRAETIVTDYEKELNEDLKLMPESEREQYISNYKKYLFAWLGAMSRCLSPMITGPANFPVRRNEKANNSEHKRSVDFREWRTKAKQTIEKKIEAAKPAEQKQSEEFESWKIQVDKLFRGWMVDRFKSRLETVAKTGNVELVKSVLDYFAAKQIEKNVVLATNRNNVWKLADVAEKNRIAQANKVDAENKEYKINGISVVENVSEDRIQIFFDGKPERFVIDKLKSSAFRWSPSQGCWQRQLTRAGIYATEQVLK